MPTDLPLRVNCHHVPTVPESDLFLRIMYAALAAGWMIAVCCVMMVGSGEPVSLAALFLSC